MRFKDFLITLLISTITSLIVIWTLINAGIIPTRQQYPQLYIKQTHSGTLVGVLNQTSKMYEAKIERIPIENVSDKATMRTIHISLEANLANHDAYKTVDINYLRLMDQNSRIVISEKSLRFTSSYAFLTIDASVIPIHSYSISLEVKGTYNFTLTYDLVIVQEVLT